MISAMIGLAVAICLYIAGLLILASGKLNDKQFFTVTGLAILNMIVAIWELWK